MVLSCIWATVALLSGINAASILDLKAANVQIPPSFTVELSSVWNKTRSSILYHIPVTLRGDVYNLILDTGSSDTWVVSRDFTCIGGYIGRNPQPPNKCTHGLTFGGSLEGRQVPNRTFFSVYGMGGFGGSFVMGNMSYESIGIGKTEVKVTQQIGIVSSGNFDGFRGTSGLLGLSYPAATQSYIGTRPETAYQSREKVHYNPLLTTMVQDRISPPMFGLALKRSKSTISPGGFITFGGLPPVIVSSPYASTPIELLKTRRNLTDTRRQAYFITPDALVYKGSNDTQTDQYVVDSGAAVTLLPSSVVKVLYNLFEPKVEKVDGVYQVPCGATAPVFGIKIGGRVFNMHPADMILQLSKDEKTGLCRTGFEMSSQGPFILGDTFLTGVVAVFDQGASELRFAMHDY